MDIFVIGDEPAILGFSLVGIPGMVPKDQEGARSELESLLTREDIKIILITENWANPMRDFVDQLKMKSIRPLLMEIPSSKLEPQGKSLNELVKEALGVQLSGQRSSQTHGE